MSQNSVKQDPFKFNDHHDKCSEPPSPMASSDDASSAEVKYLSYLAQVIDSAPQRSADNSEIQLHYQTAQYWHMVYQSAIYVKKDIYRTQVDDNLMMTEIQEYLMKGKIHPAHANQIGQQLLQNGYFLCAYAIGTGRKRKSAFIFRYLMQHFDKEYEIDSNQEEFTYILENYVENDRADEILHLNLGQSESSSNKKQLLTPGNDQSRSEEYLIPVRSPYQNRFQEDSERSKTVIIEDDSFSINR